MSGTGTWNEPSEQEVAEIVRSAKVVAVVGMKGESDRFAPAYTVPEAMRDRGIRIIPVNPLVPSALGVPSLASVAQLEGAPDVIQVFRRAEHVTPLADEIVALPAEKRPRVVWMQSGIVNEPAAEKLEAAGMRVVMDRCFAVDMAKYRRA
jgi:predicted CoA-binding protein